jgi:hypothetical protein
MRKKLSYLVAVIAAIGLLQFAIPSDSAVSEVKEEAVQSCPANKSCPTDKEAKDCTKVCPEDKASCPEGKASCPTSGAKT